jgi:3-hydroxybutyryl-CoA dehydrogenase
MSAAGPSQGANYSPSGGSAAATAASVGVPLTKDAIVAVIGAGAMGSGIAQVAAQAGHSVQLFDTRIGAADEACRKISATFDALAAKGKISPDAARNASRRIESANELADCASARIVIEAIVEDLAIKRALLRELEVIVAPETILASNTSSLSITALAAGLQHPQRVVGMHFFNPAPVLPLVEVISGLATDRALAETVYASAAAWGKLPVHASSTPGFIVNRCARPFYGEALRLLSERGADPATIDAVMRDAGGFRMGPFELMDLIGLDVNFAVTRSVWDAYFHDPRYTPSVLQQELVAAGFLGRKSGRGFFSYGVDAAKPEPSTQPTQPRPAMIRVCGDRGPAATLASRFAASGIVVERMLTNDAFPDGAISIDGGWLALTDGRTATSRGMTIGQPDLVLFDLAFDYATCTRLAVARADTCSESAWHAAIAALQAAEIAVSAFDDVAGLAVMRTVAMLANEAADAVTQGIATPHDVDLAMQKGVNYPIGPLAWADRVGVARVRDVLANLAAHYGEDRYRASPLFARRCAASQALAG